MGSQAGAMKIAAARLGMPVAIYQAHVAAGEKHCAACRKWHPRLAFATDATRSDGLSAVCREARNRRNRARYQTRKVKERA